MEHLIPDSWFVSLAPLLLLAVTAGALLALIRGADWLVEGAAGFAYRLGISKIIVGATVVSLGTTSPEAAVSVLAAWSGHSGLALGNAVGSIIADTGLIFGLGCLLAVLPADRFVLQRQGWVQFGAAMLLATICYVTFALAGDAAAITRPIGFLFLLLLAVYLVVSVRWSRAHTTPEAQAGPAVALRSVRACLGFVLLGLLVVVFSSRVLIGAVSELALRWGVPDVVIAATLVAFGTSLPELVVGMTSIIKGHRELLVGNVIGADVLNVLFVIGASAATTRLPVVEVGAQVPRIFLYLHLPTMILILLLFRLYIFAAVRRGFFRRIYGLPLVLIYIVYLVGQFVLSAGPAAQLSH